jgi:hypothetical protein
LLLLLLLLLLLQSPPPLPCCHYSPNDDSWGAALPARWRQPGLTGRAVVLPAGASILMMSARAHHQSPSSPHRLTLIFIQPSTTNPHTRSQVTNEAIKTKRVRPVVREEATGTLK